MMSRYAKLAPEVMATLIRKAMHKGVIGIDHGTKGIGIVVSYEKNTKMKALTYFHLPPGKGDKGYEEAKYNSSLDVLDRNFSELIRHGEAGAGYTGLIVGFPSKDADKLTASDQSDIVEKFMVDLNSASKRNWSKKKMASEEKYYTFQNEYETSAESKIMLNPYFTGPAKNMNTKEEKKEKIDIYSAFLITKRYLEEKVQIENSLDEEEFAKYLAYTKVDYDW